ncbi:DUF6089 family protein [Fulvivirgaceae bacterium BMA12]|uniref:DUF6089 family protein n=1 Tax=Agaribacillus aureus TaxID=3051825 RepID=A0ABT8LDA5_9BACT|nr:DUF6089 family protein [Fulvivirgaceae bacterium BMA12]
MKKLLFVSTLLTLFFISEYELMAQSRSRSRQIRAQSKRISTYRGGVAGGFGKKAYTTIGFSVNALNYFGDLAPKAGATSTDISFTRPGFGLHLHRKIGSRYWVRGSLLYGRLKGSDFSSANPDDESARFRYVRNLQFRNDIFEFSAQGVIDITPHHGTFLGRPTFTPYVFGGIAVFYHNPKGLVPETDVNTGQALEDAGKWIALEPLGTEGQYSDGSGVSPYKKVQLAVPVGIGVRYKVNESLDVEVEVGYRHLFFDHLDDVGGSYVDLNTLNSDLARVMSDRSRELTAVESGETRDLTNPLVAEIVNRRDANNLIRGYGSNANNTNIRGNSNDNDIYVITSIRVNYILGSSIFGKAKYR